MSLYLHRRRRHFFRLVVLSCIAWLIFCLPVSADVIYTVEDGDSAWSIAVRFGVSLEVLYEANGWAADENPVLQIGQHIAIPSETDSDVAETSSEGSDDESCADEGTYVVQSGDCASLVAERFNVGTLALLEYNGLTGEEPLVTGQVLNIPPEDYEVQSAFDSESQESDDPENEIATIQYTVQDGDSLWTIAQAFRVTIGSLCSLNNLNENSVLREGEEILVPFEIDAGPESRSLTLTAYTVVSGDTLGGIAARFGIPQATLMSANHLADADSLREGRELMIPAYRSVPEQEEEAGIEVMEEIPEPPPPEDFSEVLEPLPSLEGVSGRSSRRESIFDFGAIESPEPATPYLDQVGESGWSVNGHFEDGTPYHIYTVKRGDTISEVALAFSVTQTELIGRNRLDARTSLRIGRDLRIPLPRPVSVPRSATPDAPRGSIGAGEGSDIGREVVEEAMHHLGTPYVYAGSDLERGTDCSGFAMSVMTLFGVNLPHRASLQAQYGKEVDYSDLEPGDMVFFRTHSSNNYLGITHVGIYIGNGEFVHASSYRREVVVSVMDEGNYRRNFICARRMF